MPRLGHRAIARCVPIALALNVFASAGGEVGPGPRPAVPPFVLVDVMVPFWSFWDQTQRQPPTRRVAELRRQVFAPYADFYEQVVGPRSDERLARYLTELQPLIPTMRRVTRELRGNLPGYWRAFTTRFPDLRPASPVYLAPSLFTSDGLVRYVDGRPVIMLGVDVRAYVDDVLANGRRIDMRPHVHHEMFHLYHVQRNPEIAAAAKSFFSPGEHAPLYYNLWSEGLAAYAAGVLNPDVPLGDLLSSARLAADGPRVLPKVAAELLEKMSSTLDSDVRDYFYLGTRRTDLPPRVAYFVGYRVAEELAKTRSLPELVDLQGEALRGAIARTLQSLADAGSPN